MIITKVEFIGYNREHVKHFYEETKLMDHQYKKKVREICPTCIIKSMEHWEGKFIERTEFAKSPETKYKPIIEEI